MELQDIKKAWLEVFPKSECYPSVGALGGGIYTKCYLQTKNEWSNGISQNDPLSYLFVIDDNDYSESSLSIIGKPFNPHMYASSLNPRKKTIKNIDYNKLLARFKQIKQFIIDNESELHHNYKQSIMSKL